MIVDTSVWIEYLRPGTSAVGDHLEQMIRMDEPIEVPETVLMELLSGTTDEQVARERRRMLEAFDVIAFAPLADSVRAASLQRACRRAGETVRNLGDCQIAAVALRLDLAVLHCDRDFEVLATHAGLRTASLIHLR